MFSVSFFCWAVLTLHSTATCFHLQQTSSSPSAAGALDPELHQWLEAKTHLIRKKFSKRALKPVRRGSEDDSNLLRDDYTSCFSVFNMKSPAFLCMDHNRILYTSVSGSNEDCRFRRVKRHKRFYVFQSCRGDVLLVNRRRANIYTHKLPKLADFTFLKPHKETTNHRKRRSWHTDPSDPLGSEYLSTVRNWRSDPGYGGHVSKETITLVDDPLQVLLSHSAQTPTLEKHRVNKKNVILSA
ncbi:hypothetical protein Baya_12091 [Bagarius yarrelli]|uniref:Fibroblast growth factor 23 n=1 Tax=Bagarius yarrelli TaxID=175774 RepID=A0A556V2P2_BAGYA|nr:hypothetical protein Baya_12091 [Bagarius yarrelli]